MLILFLKEINFNICVCEYIAWTFLLGIKIYMKSLQVVI